MTTITAPEAIARYQLVTIKHMVKLEGLGLKHSSGRSATARAKEMLGLPKSTNRDTVLKIIEDMLQNN
jgi:hypothetical protein